MESSAETPPTNISREVPLQQASQSIPTPTNQASPGFGTGSDSLKDAPVHQSISSETDHILASLRSTTLGLSLKGKFFLAGKNVEGLDMFQRLFKKLPPDVFKGDWSWVRQLQQ
jgi:hypothetical protein